MTSILTIFDERETEDRWVQRIEEKFAGLPNAHFEHTDIAGATSLLRNRKPRIVVIGSRVLENGISDFIASLKPRHSTILLSGLLDNQRILDQFQQHGILGVPILDKVNFYSRVDGILEGLANHHRSGRSERQE